MPRRPIWQWRCWVTVGNLTCTLVVRAVILGVRGGGDPRAVRATRSVALALSVLAVVAPSVAAARGDFPPAPLFATVPTLLVTSAIAVRPPVAARLRAIGWALVAAATVTASVLVTML